jgi:cellulose synthase operon protein C
MKIVRTSRLWFREGTSDKVYHVDLVDMESEDAARRYLVNFRYGRRGLPLRDGTKTPAAVSLAEAERIFDSVVVSKTNGGYRAHDGGEPLTTVAAAVQPAEASPAARDAALIARLEACARSPWPEDQRDRLFWRVGQVRPAGAAPLLIALAERFGRAAVSYSHVWALARCAGAEAMHTLAAVARGTRNPLVNGLAEFALFSPLMGEQALPATPKAVVPDAIARAMEAGDADALYGAFDALAKSQPALVGPTMVDLYRIVQGYEQFRPLLIDLVRRAPVRPPFVLGFRRLLKYAEMIDDGEMFGLTAYRFETAKPMYRSANPYATRREGMAAAWIADINSRGYTRLTHLRGDANAKTALSHATLLYLKRRIWRSLRKRGELGQTAFLDLATGYLLAFTQADVVEPRVSRFSRWRTNPATNRYERVDHVQHFGRLPRAWSAGHLLYASNPHIHFGVAQLTYHFTQAPDDTARHEAFRALWDAHPGYALRLAAESRCEPLALFGVKVLRDNPSFLQGLEGSELETLLGSPFASVADLVLEEARRRIASGVAVDASLVAALLDAASGEARALAIAHIGARAGWPWHDGRLSLLAITSAYEDVRAAALGWAKAARPRGETARFLAESAAEWLLELPRELGEAETARLRHLRACLAALWPAHDLPLASETLARIIGHPHPEVAAAGVDALTLSGVDAASLPDTLWRQLLESPAPEVQAAGLGLLGRLGDEQLAERTFLILSLATAPAPEVRRAARPLIARLAVRFPRVAEDIASRLIDLLFQAAPDDAFAQDAVALFREALPNQLAALDKDLVWRLLQAKAKGAQLLGAEAVTKRDPATWSVRQLARLGNHSHKAVREWVMAAYDAAPQRMTDHAADAVLLVESGWEDAHDFALAYFERWPAELWTPDVLGVIADSVNPKVLAFARDTLRRTLRPGDASVQLLRLLEHPAATMHLLITEVLTAQAAEDEAVFAKLLPLSRIILLQVHKGRVAKDRIWTFLHSEGTKSRQKAEQIAPLLIDLSLSAVERDRSRAILALRDLETAHPGLAGASSPLRFVSPERRIAS